MNSLEKNINPSVSSPGQLVEGFKNEIKRLTAEELQLLGTKLQYLGSHLDPFTGKSSPECDQIVRQLHLDDWRSDPFKFTNLLLQLLDKVETELKTKIN